jgi:acyl-CoA synthetase (NDP forming)
MLDHFFNPSSVAVVGASHNPGKIGYDILNNILRYGFRGSVYPINPKAQEILGCPAFSDLMSVPSQIDLAVIALPAPGVISAVEQCGKKKVDSVIIISAGFKEIGPEGARLEQDLAARARDLGVRVVGPNCLGVIDTASALNASFAAGMPLDGHIGFFSQ